jgi:hypothetical protein
MFPRERSLLHLKGHHSSKLSANCLPIPKGKKSRITENEKTGKKKLELQIERGQNKDTRDVLCSFSL